MDDTLELELRKPIELKDVTYEKLTLVEPTVGQLEKAMSAKTEAGMGIDLIAAVAKVPRRVVEMMCQRDFLEATDFLSSFSSQKTTET